MMRSFRSVQYSFSDCPFKMNLPKITAVEPYLNIDFSVSFAGKKVSKYIALGCKVTDNLGNCVFAESDNKTNFIEGSKHTIVINDAKLRKTSFEFVLSFLVMTGDYVEIKYVFEKNKIYILKSVSVAEMTEEESNTFMQTLNSAIKQVKDEKAELVPTKKEQEYNEVNHDFDSYINAISSELFYLKNNGGKKHKVTDGHLLTPNSNEFCYSFELESELYLSDDAPVAVIKGLETVYGTVIVCDGFQIIVSLEKNIGDDVPSALISVEPWKLLEKLRDRVKRISKSDKIAWKLFHDGPKLAEKTSNISSIKKGQDAAIEHAEKEDITIIWGPPGTGKTYTMAQMTERFVSQGKSVLIVSHSNISVDNVVKQISNQFNTHGLSDILSQGKVLRYGFVRDEELSKNDNCVSFKFALKSHKDLKKQYDAFTEESAKLKIELQYKHDTEKAAKRKEIEKSLKNIRTKLKAESQALTAKARVVATTVSKIYMDKLFESRRYDVVMFDEVSMAYVPQLLCAATFAKEKFICVGDFRQLAPIVQAEKSKDTLQNDIFGFLNINKHNEIYNHPWLVMLDEQRRMHPQISKFSNQTIYKGLLKNHPSVITKWNDVVEREPLSGQAMTLIDLAATYCAASKNADNSRFNILSAILSFGIALNSENAQNSLPFKNEEKVGIITPYAAQTRLIRAIIQDYRQKESTAVSCATVHQFQGSERNVVVFDAVESYPFTKPGWLVAKNENGSVLRLINVALTRARCKFITLANTKFWYNKFNETKNTYYLLLEHIRKNNNIVCNKDNTLVELVNGLDLGENIKHFYDENNAFELILKDIQTAKKQIIITLPTDKIKTVYGKNIIDEVKKQAKHGVAVLGKAKEIASLDEDWKSLVYKSKDAVFPMIAIDDRIVWYGFPLSDLYFEDKNSRYIAIKNPIFRIRGKETIEMIYSLCDLEHRVDEKGLKIKLIEKANANAGKGFSEFIQLTEKCKKCGSSMCLFKNHNGKFMLKCSSCGSIDLLTVHTTNKYLDKINAKCSMCGKDIFAGVGQFGLYVKCNNGHFTKLSEL